MIYNIGSLNIDHVYRVPHIVHAGETLSSRSFQTGPGGKGLNQSIALARAGAAVAHIGCIGTEGRWLVDLLATEGVRTEMVREVSCASGHAIIQVDDRGENAIVVHAGANQKITPADIAAALDQTKPSDWVLLQNETSALSDAITCAANRGCQVWFNPAPYTPHLRNLPLDRLTGLIVNESELSALADCDDSVEAVQILRQRYPACHLVCTLGSKGVCWIDAQNSFSVPAVPTEVVDTTAAGDTFIGYLLAALAAGENPKAACERACHAAALTVARPGAANAIPHKQEVDSALQ